MMDPPSNWHHKTEKRKVPSHIHKDAPIRKEKTSIYYKGKLVNEMYEGLGTEMRLDWGNYLKDVVSLTGKLTDSERSLPEDLPMAPRELSFWIASHLGGSVADEQQRLLEMLDTCIRLKREYEMLDHTRKQLAARTALKETLSNVDQKNN